LQPLKYNLQLVACLLLLVLVNTNSIADELTLKGVYQGSNLYVQNPSDGQGNYCIEKVTINGKVMQHPNSSAFDIDLSSLSVGNSVEIRISHKSGCVPSILNPQAIRAREKFIFTSVNLSANYIVWATRGEKKFGQFFVQAKRNNSWHVARVISCKGSVADNTYRIPLTHRPGDNLYRIKYLEVTGKYFYSPEVNFTLTQEDITFYPRRVSTKLTFSKKVKYEILDIDGNKLKEGEGLSIDCTSLVTGTYTLKFGGQNEKFFKK
jgi:hypothetical protein